MSNETPSSKTGDVASERRSSLPSPSSSLSPPPPSQGRRHSATPEVPLALAGEKDEDEAAKKIQGLFKAKSKPAAKPSTPKGSTKSSSPTTAATSESPSAATTTTTLTSSSSPTLSSPSPVTKDTGTATSASSQSSTPLPPSTAAGDTSTIAASAITDTKVQVAPSPSAGPTTTTTTTSSSSGGGTTTRSSPLLGSPTSSTSASPNEPYVEALQNKIKQLEDELRNRPVVPRETNDLISGLTLDVEAMRTQLLQNAHKTKMEEHRVDEANRVLHSAQLEIVNKNTVLERLNLALVESRREATDARQQTIMLDGELKQREKANIRLQAEIDMLAEQVKSYQREAFLATDKVRQIQSCLARESTLEVQEQMSNMSKQLQEMRLEHLEARQRTTGEKDDQIFGLEKQLVANKTLITDAEAKLDDAKKRLQVKDYQMEELESRRQRESEDYAAAARRHQEEIDSLQNVVASIERQNHDTSRRLAQENLYLNTLKNDAVEKQRTAERQVVALHHQIEQLNTDIASLRAENIQLQTELTQFHQKLLTERNERTVETLDGARERELRQCAIEQNAHLEERIINERGANEALILTLQADKVRLESEVRELTDTLHRERQERWAHDMQSQTDRMTDLGNSKKVLSREAQARRDAESRILYLHTQTALKLEHLERMVKYNKEAREEEQAATRHQARVTVDHLTNMLADQMQLTQAQQEIIKMRITQIQKLELEIEKEHKARLHAQQKFVEKITYLEEKLGHLAQQRADLDTKRDTNMISVDDYMTSVRRRDAEIAKMLRDIEMEHVQIEAKERNHADAERRWRQRLMDVITGYDQSSTHLMQEEPWLFKLVHQIPLSMRPMTPPGMGTTNATTAAVTTSTTTSVAGISPSRATNFAPPSLLQGQTVSPFTGRSSSPRTIQPISPSAVGIPATAIPRTTSPTLMPIVPSPRSGSPVLLCSRSSSPLLGILGGGPGIPTAMAPPPPLLPIAFDGLPMPMMTMVGGYPMHHSISEGSIFGNLMMGGSPHAIPPPPPPPTRTHQGSPMGSSPAAKPDDPSQQPQDGIVVGGGTVPPTTTVPTATSAGSAPTRDGRETRDSADSCFDELPFNSLEYAHLMQRGVPYISNKPPTSVAAPLPIPGGGSVHDRTSPEKAVHHVPPLNLPPAPMQLSWNSQLQRMADERYSSPIRYEMQREEMLKAANEAIQSQAAVVILQHEGGGSKTGSPVRTTNTVTPPRGYRSPLAATRSPPTGEVSNSSPPRVQFTPLTSNSTSQQTGTYSWAVSLNNNNNASGGNTTPRCHMTAAPPPRSSSFDINNHTPNSPSQYPASVQEQWKQLHNMQRRLELARNTAPPPPSGTPTRLPSPPMGRPLGSPPRSPAGAGLPLSPQQQHHVNESIASYMSCVAHHHHGGGGSPFRHHHHHQHPHSPLLRRPSPPLNRSPPRFPPNHARQWSPPAGLQPPGTVIPIGSSPLTSPLVSPMAIPLGVSPLSSSTSSVMMSSPTGVTGVTGGMMGMMEGADKVSGGEQRMGTPTNTHLINFNLNKIVQTGLYSPTALARLPPAASGSAHNTTPSSPINAITQQLANVLHRGGPRTEEVTGANEPAASAVENAQQGEDIRDRQHQQEPGEATAEDEQLGQLDEDAGEGEEDINDGTPGAMTAVVAALHASEK